LSALAAAITTFAARALSQRKLIFALVAEPVEPVWMKPADVPRRHRGGDRQAPVCRDEGAPIARAE